MEEQPGEAQNWDSFKQGGGGDVSKSGNAQGNSDCSEGGASWDTAEGLNWGYFLPILGAAGVCVGGGSARARMFVGGHPVKGMVL